ncbi:MAG TPA: hypothetical protein VFC11_05550 [Methylocella sp.]|nr:hypothetical protein [Methylocella sp.]
MSLRAGLFIAVALTAFVAAPAFSQTAEKPKNNPGTMATMDRAANGNRAVCEREAKERKLGYFKRKTFIKNCMRR